MYPKKRLLNHGPASCGRFNPFCSETRIARPLSYFVRGGIDLDGVSSRPPLPSVSDSAEDVSSGDVDIATDARVSRLDILDYASQSFTDSEKRAAEKIANK